MAQFLGNLSPAEYARQFLHDKNAGTWLNRQTAAFTGADLANSPGYQFGLKQGQNAVETSAAAKGSLLSGATLKALEQYGQDYAGTKFNEAFNRDLATKQLNLGTFGQMAELFKDSANRTLGAYQGQASLFGDSQNRLANILGNLSGIGQQAATTQANIDYGTGQNLATILGQSGQQQANTALQKGQTQAGMWSNIGNSVNSGLANGLIAYLYGQGNGLKR